MTGLTGNTAEVVLNAELAAQLRRHGLEAEAEQSLRLKTNRHQVDLLVELGDFAVAIEAEFAPGRTVLDDAEKRLPDTPLYWRGLVVDFVFALVYPKELQRLPESRARAELSECDDLVFSWVERRQSTGTQDAALPEHTIRGRQSGSVATLAELLHDFWIRSSKSGSVEDAVEEASAAIELASATLRTAAQPHPLKDVDSDPEATTALIWLNALLFQELLAQDLDTAKLPQEFRNTVMPRPDPTGNPQAVRAQWDAILKINWWPIFHVAREALQAAPPYQAAQALRQLSAAAEQIAAKGVIRRHDVAGRIFHRLLETRKFLATNYTTIPAAVLLAGLAFDDQHSAWAGVDWASPAKLGKLRIVDPACGTGTLLMAALQEGLKAVRRAGGSPESQREAVRLLLEKAVHGYDVVPAAVHLTAATLSMAETRQVIGNMPLFWMPHDMHEGRARLGSLDFLLRSPSRGVAQRLPAFVDTERDAGRVTGTGERVFDAHMPQDCDLVIANPPYTRAGGPGTADNTDWNPMFGSALSKGDAEAMQTALKKTLQRTPASLYAGLGSAFVVLASEKVRPGGRIAFVLPATALTGSRWRPIRELLLEGFYVDWVVVSHDPRNRPARGNLPGRRFVAFSESTRIAEALIVATKRGYESAERPSQIRFVNLRRNPDEPIEAMAVVRALLSSSSSLPVGGRQEVIAGDSLWGEVKSADQGELSGDPWTLATFVQGRLADIASTLVKHGVWQEGQRSFRLPITTLGLGWSFGPYEMQIKNPTQGLFDIADTADPTRSGHPALWHHGADRIKTLGVSANARLTERIGKKVLDQAAMLAKAGRLQIARELGHAPQRLAAVVCDEAMLGVRSWITLTRTNPLRGSDEALCVWLNTSLGLLLRIVHANRPYLGRTALPHELARTLPVLDVAALSEAQRTTACELFEDLKHQPLQGFAHLGSDPVRRELDRRFFGEVLGHSSTAEIDKLAQMLNREPTLTTRH